MLPVILTGDVAVVTTGARQRALTVALDATGVGVCLIPTAGARNPTGIQVSPVLETLGAVIPPVTVLVFRAGFRLPGAVAIAAFASIATATSIVRENPTVFQIPAHLNPFGV